MTLPRSRSEGMNTMERMPARAAWAATLHARLPVEAQARVSKPNSTALVAATDTTRSLKEKDGFTLSFFRYRLFRPRSGRITDGQGLGNAVGAYRPDLGLPVLPGRGDGRAARGLSHVHSRSDGRVVAYITGNGLKTQEAVEGVVNPLKVRPTLSSFEEALQDRPLVTR